LGWRHDCIDEYQGAHAITDARADGGQHRACAGVPDDDEI
jgi:hypothetical protein